MKDLTKAQAVRLDAAIKRFDKLIEDRPIVIRDEIELTPIIEAIEAATRLLAAGQTIYVGVTDEDGIAVALAQIVLEPAGR